MTKLCLNIEHLRQPDIHKSDESITFSNIHFLCFRYSEGQCWHPQQLQLVSHQEHPVGRDHHRCSEFSSPEQICLRLQLQRTGERLYSVSRVLRGEIIFCEIILLSQCWVSVILSITRFTIRCIVTLGGVFPSKKCKLDKPMWDSSD